MIQEIHIDALR